MAFGDIKDYCKANNVPVSAVKCNPQYNSTKGRVTKGQTICHSGWKEKNRFENVKACKVPFDDATQPTMWIMSLKNSKLFVIDIDVKNGKSAKDVLKEEIYENLYNSSNYVIETGSKGLHFYFKLPQTYTGKSKDYINIEECQGWFKDGEEGSVDLIMDSIITEGSNYTFDNVTYKYINIKPGNTINDVTECPVVWDTFYTNIILEKEKQTKKVSNKTIIEVEEIVEHLENIPNTSRSWENWYKMGQTLFNILGSNGYELFQKWSSKCTYHNEVETFKLWKGLSTRTDNSRNIGSLLYDSRQANEENYFKIRSKYAPLGYDALKQIIEENHFFIEEPKPLYIRVKDNSLIYYKPAEMAELLMTYNFTTVIEMKDKEIEKTLSFYAIWSKDPTKRKYRCIGYYPNAKDCPSDEFNGFFPCRASKLPPNSEKKDISPILNHISIIANHDEKGIKFITQGFAQMIQQPSILKGIAFLLFAEEGAGKDALIQYMGEKILGEHQYAFVGNIDNLFKSFNSELSGKILIHCDEIIKLDKKNTENLKRMVTSGRTRVEKKGIDASLERSFARLYMTTNNRDCMSVSITDRRLAIFNSSNEKTKDIDYFKQLFKVMEDDTIARAFYDYLMEVDLSDYDHTNRPETEFYKEMKAQSLDTVLVWIADDDSFADLDDTKMRANDWMKKYNYWAEMNKVRLHNLTSFGVSMNNLIKKNIGIEKKNPQNKCHYIIDKEKVIEYLKKEELIGDEKEE